jgi:hypothetical protein
MLPVRLAGAKLCALVDSGATDSVISVAAVQRHGFARHMCAPLAVQVAGGGTVTVHERVQVKMALPRGHTLVSAIVMPTVLGHVDLILGCDWLAANKAVLDFGSDSLSVVHAGSRVRLEVLPHPSRAPKPQQLVAQCIAVLQEAYGPPDCLITAKQAVSAVRQGARVSWLLVRATPPQVYPGAAVATAGATDLEQLTPDLPEPVAAVLQAHKDVFGPRPPGLPKSHGVEHTIALEPGTRPIFLPTYRLSPLEQEEVKRQVTDLLAKGYITPSQSPYGAPILFVQKKDGSLRMCIDYRQLNKVTVKDRFPLPRIDDIFDKLQGCTMFSSLDCDSAYWQVRISDEDVPKTAFRVPGLGHYEWRVLCFGLTNAPATFQRLMHRCLDGLIGVCCMCYLDDIIVMSRSAAEHAKHLAAVLTRLKKYELYLKFKKCEFCKPELRFLGHIVSAAGVAVDPAKTAVVQQWPVPKCLPELQGFLGLANYFRKHVQGYSTLVADCPGWRSWQKV